MYTAREIEKATNGYVNSGVLRQWIVKGYIKAGPRVKLPGGPRSFSHREVIKAALIADLRRCGINLDYAADVAEQIASKDDRAEDHLLASGISDVPEGEKDFSQFIGDEAMEGIIYYVLVDPRRNRVTSISFSESELPFAYLLRDADGLLILNYEKIRERVRRASASWDDQGGAT